MAPLDRLQRVVLGIVRGNKPFAPNERLAVGALGELDLADRLAAAQAELADLGPALAAKRSQRESMCW